MALTLVTGGTGLVGSHVVRQLVARGDDVRIAVRDGSLLDNLGGLDVELVTADVLDRSAVRRAMRGVERVFHCAGMTSLRAGADALFRANVDGLAHRAGGGAARGRPARDLHLVGGRGRAGAARVHRRRDADLPGRALRAALRQRQARGGDAWPCASPRTGSTS